MPRKRRRRTRTKVVRRITYPSSKLTEARVFELIQDRHPAPAWATLRTVADSTGGGPSRFADAVSMSLWPSRGLELHGFEIKLSRSDWRQELKNPKKAEAIGAYCDRWWLVIGDESIVKDGELPPLWGLLVVDGVHLKTLVKAKLQETELLPLEFVAALLRRAQESHATAEAQIKEKWIKRDEVQDEITKSYEEGVEHGKRQAEFSLREYKTKLESVERFEKAAGLQIDHYHGDQIGRAVKYVLKARSIEYAIKSVKRSIDNLDQAVQRVKKEMEEF